MADPICPPKFCPPSICGCECCQYNRKLAVYTWGKLNEWLACLEPGGGCSCEDIDEIVSGHSQAVLDDNHATRDLVLACLDELKDGQQAMQACLDELKDGQAAMQACLDEIKVCACPCVVTDVFVNAYDTDGASGPANAWLGDDEYTFAAGVATPVSVPALDFSVSLVFNGVNWILTVPGGEELTGPANPDDPYGDYGIESNNLFGMTVSTNCQARADTYA